MDPTNALNAHASPDPGPDPSNAPGPRPAPDPAPPGTPPTHETAVHHSLVSTGGEQCPSCGAHVASDQRYCLRCGARCGEPRLPFMNAVTFMDAMRQPAEAAASAPPKRPKRRLSPNAALIATIGTLLLAMGVGVLIGRSGNDSVATAPQQAPIVIKGGSGGAEEETAPGAKAGKSNTIGGGGAKKQAPKALKKEAETQAGAEEVLKPANGVKLPKANQEIGGSCAKGTAGCSKSGKFEGNFFGEE
jgi:hypothetical protein